MKKETGRLDVNVGGTITALNKSGDYCCVYIGDKTVYIRSTSKYLLSGLEVGSIVSLECYKEKGKFFATGVSNGTYTW